MEIQDLIVNPKSRPVKLNSKQYQFLFKCVSNKNQWQNFSNERKNLILWFFSAKGIFPKNSG